MRNKKEQFKRFLRWLMTIMLVLSQTFIFAHVWITEYNDSIVLPFVQKGNWFFYGVYALFLTIFLHSFDGLKVGVYRKTNIIIAQVLAAVSAAFIIYLQIVLLSAGFVTPLPLVLMVIADVIIIFLFSTLGEAFLRRIFPARKSLVIWDLYSPEPFMDKLLARQDKFSVGEMVNVSVGFPEVEKMILNSECVVIYDVHSEMRNKIIKTCFENNIRTYSTTKISDILTRGAECVHLFDTPLLLYRNIGLTFEQRIAKRSLDIIVSLLLLILSSPIFLVCAIAIKLYDGGPVFFRQARATLNGKIFYIHKFRSMIVDAEKDGAPHPAEEEDKRITPVGKLLRASRLDELPQLIDILIGNMSLVGPRPERIEHVKQYTEEIPEFQFRLKVRGGLTGYAQLYGKYNTSPYDKLQLDLMYIQNYSFFLDIRLLLTTVKILFMKESTEGFTKENSRKMGKNYIKSKKEDKDA